MRDQARAPALFTRWRFRVVLACGAPDIPVLRLLWRNNGNAHCHRLFANRPDGHICHGGYLRISTCQKTQEQEALAVKRSPLHKAEVRGVVEQYFC